MLGNRFLTPLLSLPFCFLLACTSEKKEENAPSTADIPNAIEITLPLYATETANTGYGNDLEVQSDSVDKYFFSREHNTEWYKFKATENGRLTFVLEPTEVGDDYDFLLFRHNGEDFAKEIITKTLQPLRTNMAANSTETGFNTGLACDATNDYEDKESRQIYSNALEVQKDELFYLAIDHRKGGGKGYTIKFSYCGPGASDGGAVDSTITSELPPPPTPAPVATPEAKQHSKPSSVGTDVPPPGPDEEYYIVKPGNTVYSVATGHGMKVFDMMRRNRLAKNEIFIGQRLIVNKIRTSTTMKEVAKETPPVPKTDPATNPTSPGETATPPVTETKPAVEPKTPAIPDNMTDADLEKINARSAKPVASGNAPTGSVEATNAIPENVKKLYVYVNVVNSKNNNPVNTIVQVVDGKNTRRVDRIPSNALAGVPLYADGGRKKVFVIDAFSFRKETFELDLENLKNDSSASMISLVADTVVLNFELERYRKKDIFAAYNIYFYDDANVMLPKSKYELESLVEMMKENPRSKIRIHGHTNSNAMGKIVSLEANDHDFFRLSSKNKEGFGTAVQLSKKRAESIRSYLIFRGVKDARLEMKGWGGKKMIYEKDQPLAHKNKRVEIEILED